MSLRTKNDKFIEKKKDLLIVKMEVITDDKDNEIAYINNGFQTSNGFADVKIDLHTEIWVLLTEKMIC